MNATRTKRSYRPTGDRLLVRVDDAEARTPGGLYVPETHQKRPRTGTVLRVGPGRRDEVGSHVGMPFDEGDRVLFNLYAGVEVAGDPSLLVVGEGDVLAVIEEEE